MVTEFNVTSENETVNIFMDRFPSDFHTGGQRGDALPIRSGNFIARPVTFVERKIFGGVDAPMLYLSRDDAKLLAETILKGLDREAEWLSSRPV